MEIIKARPIDLIEVLYLLKVCSCDMKSLGFKQGNLSQNDFAAQNLQNAYIVRDNNLALGLIFLTNTIPLDYNGINWNSNSPRPLAIDLLIVHPNWQDRNIGENLLLFAEEYARENGFTSIRLDAFGENTFNNNLFRKLEFQPAGEFHTHFQKVPFYCYEKLI